MMERIVVIGGGGHAKVVIDLLLAAGEYAIAGSVDRRPEACSDLGIPLLGDDDRLPELYRDGVRYAFVAIGANRLRRRLGARAVELGFRLANAVSPTAILSPRVSLGTGIAIMPGVVINACSQIGDGVIVNTGATVDHDCEIGAWAHIAPGTNLAGCVRVGEGAFLGVGCSVIPGVSIGAWTTVGAGGVVIRDLPAEVTAIGVPTRVKGESR